MPPLDPEFLADCPYAPEAVLFDEVIAVDETASAIRVRMPTRDDLPLTQHQRVHPTRHPRHVNGGLMVHLTGMVGMAHAYFLLGLRHRDGWIGYGAVINKARYPNIATIGDPLDLEARAAHIRGAGDKRVIAYEFTFTQDDNTVFESNQTAMFMRMD
jgi:hypothetical protein